MHAYYTNTHTLPLLLFLAIESRGIPPLNYTSTPFYFLRQGPARLALNFSYSCLGARSPEQLGLQACISKFKVR